MTKEKECRSLWCGGYYHPHPAQLEVFWNDGNVTRPTVPVCRLSYELSQDIIEDNKYLGVKAV